jgi:hypothetical protein
MLHQTGRKVRMLHFQKEEECSEYGSSGAVREAEVRLPDPATCRCGASGAYKLGSPDVLKS